MSTEDQLFAGIEQKLGSIPMFSKKGAGAANFDLSGMRHFCNVMGNPQNNFPSVHVAGTNGKGTTCRMLASIYQEAGYHVGLYTSPHLTDVKERFISGGKVIETSVLNEFIENFWDFIIEHRFTYFEITTAIAFWFFSRENVDIAIIETGLGGRLDATNVISPLASVITSVGFDHTDILGDTIDKIAKEKSGIIKKNTPVITGRLTEDALRVVRSVSNQMQAALFNANQFIESFEDSKLTLKRLSGEKLSVSILGGKKTDALNASVALTVTDVLQEDFPVSRVAMKKGIEKLSRNYPGKGVFNRLIKHKSWYFDGAHNPDSVKELTNHLKRIAPAKQWSVVLSFMSDKLNSEVADYWNHFPNIWIVGQNNERAASIEQMKTFFPKARVLNLCDENGLPDFKTELVIFSGSFYFYTIISDWMGSGTASNR